MRRSNEGQKVGSLSNMVQLKLVQSSHTNLIKYKQESLNLKPLPSVIHAPSPIDKFKKFHSCDIQQDKNTLHHFPPQINMHRRSESATKILSVWEIKKQQSKAKGKDRSSLQGEQVKGGSRKIFISISRRSDRGHSNNRKNPQLKEEDCCLVVDQPKRQRMKLSIYKNIAGKHTITGK